MAPTKTPRTIKPLRVPVAEKPHPSRGGRAYSRDVRAIVSAAPNVLPIIPGVTPSERTRRRWNQRLHQEGHNREYERRGNKRPGALVGSDKWLLLLFRSAFPKATAAEAAAFIYRNILNHIPRIFSPSQITAAEYSLGLTRKRSSTSAVQAMTPENLLDREMFWTMNFPFGVVGIPTISLIDLVECGVMLEDCNRLWERIFWLTSR